jgi:hypothetical protein
MGPDRTSSGAQARENAMDKPAPKPSGSTRPARSPLPKPARKASAPVIPATPPRAEAAPASARVGVVPEGHAKAVATGISFADPETVAAGLGPGPVLDEIATDEEKALLYVLRLVDRVVGPGTLSPVERAFVEGARVMFDRLAKACKEMLARKPTDYAAERADPNEPPRSTAPTRVTVKPTESRDR